DRRTRLAYSRSVGHGRRQTRMQSVARMRWGAIRNRSANCPSGAPGPISTGSRSRREPASPSMSAPRRRTRSSSSGSAWRGVSPPARACGAVSAGAPRLALVRVDAAAPQAIPPGSYAFIEGEPLPAGTLSLGLWLRLWKIPVIDVVQIGWQALITDIDY